MVEKTHLVDAHQHPVDQSYNHHLLEVLHRRVLIDLLHDEVCDELGNVPSKKKRLCRHRTGDKAVRINPPGPALTSYRSGA